MGLDSLNDFGGRRIPFVFDIGSLLYWNGGLLLALVEGFAIPRTVGRTLSLAVFSSKGFAGL